MKLLALFLLLVPSLVMAQSSQTPNADIKVALADVAPFAVVDANGFRGLHYEILKQLEANSGLSFKYDIYPHVRLVRALSPNNTDLLIFFKESCEKYSDYEVQKVLYTAKPAIYLKEAERAKDKELKIGRMRGTCTKLFSQFVKPENVFDVTNMEQAMSMLGQNRLDGVCGLGEVIRYYLTLSDVPSMKLVPIHVNEERMEGALCRNKHLSKEVKMKLEAAAKNLKFEWVDISPHKIVKYKRPGFLEAVFE